MSKVRLWGRTLACDKSRKANPRIMSWSKIAYGSHGARTAHGAPHLIVRPSGHAGVI